MKQKVVIGVALNDKKACTKAIKTAVGVNGVVQAALQREKNQIEVTGVDIDVVLLTNLLRKSLKHAEVVSVSPVEDKKKEDEIEPLKFVWPYVTPATYYHPIADPSYATYNDTSCTIS